jgi:hypothetical protein
MSIKFITLLFGVVYTSTNSCTYGYSNSLNYKTNYSVVVCDFTLYEANYPIISFKTNNRNKDQEEVEVEEEVEEEDRNKVQENTTLFDNVANIALLFLIVVFSLGSSIVFVSNCVYSSMVNQFVANYNNNKEIYEYDPYLFEYLDEFNQLKSSVLSVDFLNSLKYKFLKHNTPKGEIIMSYNHLCNNFDYYCKKSNVIDFNYLDVVARIYVVKNDCKHIYVDKCENYDYGLDVDDSVDDSVVDSVTTNDDATKKKESAIFYNKSNNNVKSCESIDYVSNKYKYKGTIEEFYSYCTSNNYKIHYNDLLENSNTNYCITFSIDKEDIIIGHCDSKKYNIRFKEFKKFQKF